MIQTAAKIPPRLGSDVAALAQLVKTKRAAMHAAIGHRMALTRVPQALRTNVDGWPSPKPFPRAYRRGGQPLLDTRRLSTAIAYRATEQSVTIGTNLRYGRILQKGGIIRPRYKKWLLVPQSPPLSISEVRTFPAGKAAIQARYPGSFWSNKGPEGPGIYREVRGKPGQRSRKYGDRRMKNQITATWHRHEYEGQTIELIAAGRKKVVIFRFNWLRFRAADVSDAKSVVITLLVAKKLPSLPATGGNPLGTIGAGHA